MLKRIGCIVICVIFAVSVFTVSASTTSQSYVINLEGEKQEIPVAYSVTKTYSFFNLEKDTLSAPEDIYVDSADRLYILDSGNGRIIKLDKEGNILKEYIPSGEYALKNPRGIYVDEEENIYVADTDNGRIIRMNKDGEINLRLVQPDSELYDSGYEFKPIKVEVDPLGQVYVLNNLDYHGFIILDMENDFKGYLGATKVSSSIWTKLISMFASESQKDKLGQAIPPSHSNFTIGSDGSIYTVTANSDSQQFKQYSAVGNNFYTKTDSFGDSSVDYIMEKFGKEMESPSFSDVCVDRQGVISLVDNLSGRIYQYDSDGNMLCAFGGTGNWAGRFMNPTAIDSDSGGNLYVLDKNLNTVQIFTPTKFITTVKSALELYNNGKYIEAQELWQEILKYDALYPIAHIGMGKAELKQGNYKEAMEHYKLANSKTGYSEAFEEQLKVVIRKNFLLIIIVIFAGTAVIYFVVTRLYRKGKKWANE